MQRFLVLITSIFTILFALSVKVEPNCNEMTPRPYVEPITLANMAFRGAFQEQGIPSSAQLGNEFRSGTVTGQDIVQAAINSCYLNNDYGMETNPNFARDVESQLEAIYAGS